MAKPVERCSFCGRLKRETKVEAARKDLDETRFAFVQGDATSLPVAEGSIDTVLMFGGIHHVNPLFGIHRHTARPGHQARAYAPSSYLP